ncbi:hypothetical protein KKHLCK_00255 [Candidatus Electrothrix laxa]
MIQAGSGARNFVSCEREKNQLELKISNWSDIIYILSKAFKESVIFG